MSDKLLFALSSKGSVNYSAFCGIIDNLCLIKTPEELINGYIGMERFNIIRSLEALGHCDIDYETRRVTICRPCLLLIPSFGVFKAVYVGARIQKIIKKLRNFARRNNRRLTFDRIIQSTKYGTLPSAIFIEALDIDILEKAAERANIDQDFSQAASWRIANFSGSLASYERALNNSFEKREEPNWRKRYFLPSYLRFGSFPEEGDSRLVSYEDPVIPSIRRHWYWKGEFSVNVDRDWGRYIILAKERMRIFYYNDCALELLAPLTVRIPKVLERALVMSSGIAPIKKNIPLGKNQNIVPFLLYKNIPFKLAELVSKKLGQKLLARKALESRKPPVSTSPSIVTTRNILRWGKKANIRNFWQISPSLKIDQAERQNQENNMFVV